MKSKKADIPVKELKKLLISELIEKYDVSQRTIYRYKKATKLTRKKNGPYISNLSVLSSWSENSAYLLGYFAADGYISLSKSDSSINSIDKEHLEKVTAILFHNRRPLYKVSERAWAFSMGKELTKQWITLGITPQKSKTFLWPKIIPHDFECHFIRGFFDGDGNVYLYQSPKRKSPSLHVGIATGSENLAQTISSKLLTYSIENTIYHTSCFYVRIWRKKSVKRFYDLIYNNASLYLERKKQIFDSYYERPDPKIGRPVGKKWSVAEREKRMELYYIDAPSKNRLSELYYNKQMTTIQVGEILGCSCTKVCNLMERYNLPRRPVGRISKVSGK